MVPMEFDRRIYSFFFTVYCLPAILYCFPNINTNKIIKHNLLQRSWQCISNNNVAWMCTKLDDEKDNLFKEDLISRKQRNIIAEIINWIPDYKPNNICKGFYYQYPIKSKTVGKSVIELQRANYSINDILVAEGKIKFTQGVQYVSANKAILRKNSIESMFSTIDLSSVINTQQPGRLVTISNFGTASVKNNTSVFYNTFYLIRMRTRAGKLFLVNENQNFKEFTGFGRGHADVIIQYSKTNYKFKNATYTTIGPYHDNWILKMDKLELDAKSGVGKAYNTTLYTQGIPVLHWPYLTFPVNNHRLGGFLYPSFGFNDHSGYQLCIPFYWSISQKCDLILTPMIYDYQGILINSDFGYLTHNNHGKINIKYIPYHKKTIAYQKSFSITNNSYYGQHWQSYFNCQYINDRKFYESFETNSRELFSSTWLKKKFRINYRNLHWKINGKYQSDRKVGKKIDFPSQTYSVIPKVIIKGIYPKLLSYINFKWVNEITYFYKPSLSAKLQKNGQRFYSEPKINFPIQKGWGYLNFFISLNKTLYVLEYTKVNCFEKHILRSLPILSIEKLLYLDQNFIFKKNSYKQRFWARIFYTYTHYKDQNNIPLFDTSLNTFSYSSLFINDFYRNIDRINSANQLAYRFETRIENTKNEQELVNGAIGQIIYLSNRKVALTDKKALFYDTHFSNIIIRLKYNFLKSWKLQSNFAYNFYNSSINSQIYQVQYMSDAEHIFNVSYENIRKDSIIITPKKAQQHQSIDSLEQISLSVLWKLTPHWSIAALCKYLFNIKYVNNLFAAIQYSSCSWTIRLLAFHYTGNWNNENAFSIISYSSHNTYMIQFELKGIGNTKKTLLNKNLAMINGYNKKNSPF